jgi:GntR family transcriptional regulator / MocR family aminotransferase
MKLRINLDRASQTPLNRQLYDEMTRLILNGVLEPGARLPASRALADELGVSRPTVSACLEQLVQEGYIETKPNSGSFVSSNISKDALGRAREKSSRGPKGASIADYELSEYGKFVSAMPDLLPQTKEPEISFYCWRPALDHFPLTEWARVLGRHTRTSTVDMLDADWDPQGRLDLREALAKLVKRFRQVSCHPDQIFPVMGLNQGIDLVSRIHLDTGCISGRRRQVVSDSGGRRWHACGQIAQSSRT